MSAERARTLKESLGGDGEKFGRISGAIGIKQRRYSRFIGGLERGKLGPHHFAPRQLLFARRQNWRAIRGVVLVVELVGEFVDDKILTIGRIGRATFGR